MATPVPPPLLDDCEFAPLSESSPARLDQTESTAEQPESSIAATATPRCERRIFMRTGYLFLGFPANRNGPDDSAEIRKSSLFPSQSPCGYYCNRRSSDKQVRERGLSDARLALSGACG